jgi:hypothetical protein
MFLKISMPIEATPTGELHTDAAVEWGLSIGID